ncbi:MAG: type II secretion system protein, partial [bacterium]|nr:type II secretion system protein [bacterium]
MFLVITFIRKKIASGRILASGFTLIELVITIGVFSIGVLAAFSLAIGNSNDNRANKDRIIAANLAREALELTRNIRDSDWLCTDSNVCYFGDSILVSNNFILVDYNINSAGVVTCSGYGDLEECMNNCKNDNSCRIYRGNTDDFYSHDNTGAATNFSRVVGLQR